MAVEPSPQFEDVVVDPVASGKWDDNPKVTEWVKNDPISPEEKVENTKHQYLAATNNSRELKRSRAEKRKYTPEFGPPQILHYLVQEHTGARYL